MFIKTLKRPNSQKQVQHPFYSTLPTRKQSCFEYPYREEQLFTDESWYHKVNVIPHIETHRPTAKRRILKLKQSMRSPSSHKNAKNSNKANETIFSRPRRKDNKKQKSSSKNKQKSKDSRLLSVKHDLIRQASEMPQYAKNIMRPCKIQSINIGSRPVSARKIQTADYRTKLNRKLSDAQKLAKNPQEIQIKPLTHFWGQNAVKIGPWVQVQQDYTIY